MDKLSFKTWLNELVSPMGSSPVTPMDQMDFIKKGAFPTGTLPNKFTTAIRRNKPIAGASTVKLMSKPTP